VESPHRLPQLNCVAFKDGIDESAVRRQLLADYQLEIGAGLGPLAGKVWRIGLMGYAANQKNVLLCLGALESVLSENGVPVEAGQAVEAAQKIYSKNQ
jgi:alanine-glyoxylate transaminase/serine-glyoxylate transaminase/serine-pyruvate transaminase